MAKATSPRDTPMMRQYLATKAQHPDALLFMRMGDFYELFFDDAVTAAQVLGITLTCRNKGADEEVPMAGVPWRSLSQHLPKALAAGWKVAVMDQLEDPKDAKGLVERGLTRVITAGTLIDEDVLQAGQANWLVAITALDDAQGAIGIAALDVSTGAFQVEEAHDADELALALARLQPAELLMREELAERTEDIAALFASRPPPLARSASLAWRASDARRFLGERLGVGALDGYGLSGDDDHLASAAGAALRYAEAHALQALEHVRRIVRVPRGDHLLLDATCRRNLELLRNSRDGGREGTLLAAIDRTRTAPGRRLLGDWLSRPLARLDAITARLDAVQFLHEDALRGELREALAGVYDLERLLARVATARCHARDLVQLAGSLDAAARIRDRLQGLPLPQLLADLIGPLAAEPSLRLRIAAELVDDPPLSLAEGGLVRDGVDAELDELRGIRRDAGEWLAAYQVREAERSGISRLKVGYNKVFGYYLEINKAYEAKIPPHFIRKQTLVGAERYITAELKEYEDKALGSEERIRLIETRIFNALRTTVQAALPALQDVAAGLARLDVLAGLAETARLGGWCRPTLSEAPVLHLDACRHPVVEQVLGPGRFVANDTALDGSEGSAVGRLAVITGPNMAGKSTYIRQVALAVVLAQAGSFLPAKAATVGLVDRLFTRVGAGDELARNLSTFMVEMAETAAILNNATARSLVVLDEVGRGTSTFDGLSLAWAITEYLHDKSRSRCLFATHYHELTDLAADRAGVRNLTVAVAEQDDDVVFLHRIEAGAATKSYGIHVARLAGVPKAVLKRARQVLATLEQLNVSLSEREKSTARNDGGVQLTLFAPATNPALDRLLALELDELSPREALDTLFALQAEARRG